MLYANECFGVCIGLIRQELDSLLRVAYLIDHSNTIRLQFRDTASELIENSTKKGEWQISEDGQIKRITDAKMIKNLGWEKVVYEFGCGLVHLSNKHLYKENDPVINLTSTDKKQIIYYLNKYHGYSKENITMEDVIEYLPKIFLKIFDNIECHLSEIIELNEEVKLFE